jgi:HK97 family phage prohead protease
MGVFRRAWQWFTLASAPVTFSESSPRPIAELLLEMNGAGLLPRAGRAEALSVAPVLRGRNLICSISTLPLVQYNPQLEVTRLSLLEQIDPDVPNVVTLAQTVEDLLFEGLSWWRITAFGADGYPTSARHLDYGSVSLQPPGGHSPAPLPGGYDPRGAVIYYDGEPIGAAEVIRFDSPNPGLLKAAGRAIRRALLLDQTSALYADNPRPQDYFSPADGADPADDEEVRAILDEWRAARKKRSTAYVPAALKYNSVDTPTPADLQLIELTRKATLDIANALGLDPEDLGVSTTSRTYQNGVDRRQDRINDVLSPYMKAVTDRLSMGDVTKRGYRVAFDLDDYLRADPLTRAQFYQHGIRDHWLTPEEARVEEKRAPLPAGYRWPSQDPAPEPLPDNVRPLRASAAFDRPAETFVTASDEHFRVDTANRTIEGLALPYGRIALSRGRKFRFLPGSLEYEEMSRNKLLRDHDYSQALGKLVHNDDQAGGMFVRYKVGRGVKGDEALANAEDGVVDGLSVGIDVIDAVPDPENKGVTLVRRAYWRETSLTAMPAFDDARVTRVAASRDQGDPVPENDTETTPATVPAPPTPPSANQAAGLAGLNLSRDQISALLAHPGALQALLQPPANQQPTAPATPPGGLTLSREQLDAIIASGGLGTLLGVPQLTPAPRQHDEPEQRQTVDPTRRTAAVTATSEALPYRFDRGGNLTKGETWDFSTDLISGAKGDAEALARTQKFLQAMAPAFTHAEFVDKSNAAALNPSINRPDLYVDQKDFSYPIWDAIAKGTLADSTPFVLPKFSSSSGLVAAHVEGTEPTAGTFVAAAQTITPSAVSGKVEITREAWDQGGNPQLSGIIWRQMVRAWFEALEASAVTLLDGLTPTGITLSTAASDDVLVGELEAALAALQFVRGGLRMRDMFLQVDLYKALVAATDADGRKLLPLLGAVNASGQVSELYADVSVGGLRGRPAWALAASGSVAASSYLFDRNDVHGWATAPMRLEFQYRVAFVDVAIWGYKALANTDLTGVREIIYDPA